jgi:sugar phosphate isomerase/epimerase
MELKLGINLGFAINRYIEPEVWSRIVAEDLRLRHVQFVADLLNPFWPKEYVADQIQRIRAATAAYGISVDSMFTSVFTRVNHLMHPDAEARKFWREWFLRFLETGAELGARTLGSHFGILTAESYNDSAKREFLIEQGVKGWQALTQRAKVLGYDSLIFEPMSVPREMANTVGETLALLDRVNADAAVPLRLCLDIGHAPHPDERDPYPWLERLAQLSPVIHLQQTVLHRSNHAPFTPEQNAAGIIHPEKVLAAIRKSGCTKSLLAFEIGHREHYDTEFRVVEDLKASADYWRPYVET